MNEPFNPPAIYGEVVAGRAAKVRRSLLDLSADVKASTFDMAELLFEAQEHNYPAQWGFSSVLDYAEKELGLKERKAQYLTRTVKVCRAVGLTRAQYEPAGTSKLREITTLNPDGKFFNTVTHENEPLDEHIVRLILDADKMTVKETKEEVARLKGQVGANRRVMRSYSTDITTWTNVIDVAIERARKFLGSKGRDETTGNAKEYSEGECYECICASFLADPNYDPDIEEIVIPTEDVPNTPVLPMESI